MPNPFEQLPFDGPPLATREKAALFTVAFITAFITLLVLYPRYKVSSMGLFKSRARARKEEVKPEKQKRIRKNSTPNPTIAASIVNPFVSKTAESSNSNEKSTDEPNKIVPQSKNSSKSEEKTNHIKTLLEDKKSKREEQKKLLPQSPPTPHAKSNSLNCNRESLIRRQEFV